MKYWEIIADTLLRKSQRGALVAAGVDRGVSGNASPTRRSGFLIQPAFSRTKARESAEIARKDDAQIQNADA